MRALFLISGFYACAIGAVLIPTNQDKNDYSAQNSGKTGLIETPNARVMDDWRVRLNYFYSDPFLYYGLLISPLPRLELNLRMTQLKGVAGFSDSSGYGNYKDKAIDFKFLLSKEDRYWPAIAIGADDIQGTGLYSSKYMVATKRFDFLEMSVGYALGRLGGENLAKYGTPGIADRGVSFLTDLNLNGGSIFGGAEIHFTPDLSLKMEYSPINYGYEVVNPFVRGYASDPKSKINAGIKYKLTNKLSLSANYERGTSYGIGINYTIPFSDEGLYIHKKDDRWRATPGTPERFDIYNDRNLSGILADEIAAEKYSNVQVAINGNKIWASVENPKYNSSMKALGRAADIIDETAPGRIDDLYLALKQTDLEYSALHVSREDVRRIKAQPSMPIEENTIKLSSDVEGMYDQFTGGKDVYKTPSVDGEKFSWLYKPTLESFLNDKDNPLVYKFSLLGGARYEVAQGGYVFGRFLFPLYNNTGGITPKPLEPENSSVRTDSLKYLQYNGVQLYDFAYDQTVRLAKDLYGRAEVGYFESAYGGLGLELYRPIAGGRYGIGLEYQNVQKRRVDDMFAFEDTRFDGKFINLYANLYPPLGIKTTARIGQFLAGDKGISWTLMREYKDFTIGAFITKTTSDVFASPDNRGYMDKGVFLTMPLSTVIDQKLKGHLNYSLKPWTRDVAQHANQLNSLVGLEPANVFDMNQDREMFKK